MWVDKEGNEEPINAPPNFYRVPDISPDGEKVALTVGIDGNTDIYIWDLVRENLSRLTFDKQIDQQSIWTPDGKRIVFMSARNGPMDIYSKAADGTGEVETLCSAPDMALFPYSWSGDGKTLVIAEAQSDMTHFNIGTVSSEGDGTRELLLKEEEYNESQAQISPDGRWMAYFSDETGDWELYVRPFPDVNKGKWQISTGGGDSPRWSPDGREIFYLNSTGDSVMAVPVETEPTFSAGKPRMLFQKIFVAGWQESLPYDIHPDGKRLLMIKPSTGDATVTGPHKITIVLNWFEELKQRVPVD